VGWANGTKTILKKKGAEEKRTGLGDLAKGEKRAKKSTRQDARRCMQKRNPNRKTSLQAKKECGVEFNKKNQF